MRAYLTITRSSFMVWLAYRIGFIFTIVGNIIYIGILYYLWSSIYANSETIRGMTFDQTFLYAALGSSIFVLLKTYTDWFISGDITQGNIITDLIKPIDYQLLVLARSVGGVLINFIGVSLPTILMMVLFFRVRVDTGLGLWLFPLSIGLAFLINFTFDYMIGLTAFYTESVWGISITKEIIVTLLSGALLPLQFFPDAIRSVLLWLPFQAIYHIPLTMITRPTAGWDVYFPMLMTQLFWVVALFLLSRLFYRQAIKILRIAGG